MKKRSLLIIVALMMSVCLIGCGSMTGTGDPEDLWLIRNEWTETPSAINGVLFHETQSVPFDLMEIDAYAAPYVVQVHNEYYNIESIEEILSDEQQIAASSFDEVEIFPNSRLIEGEEYKRENLDPDNLCGISMIKICNINENLAPMSIQDCYENNWWYIEGDSGSYSPFSLQIENNGEFNVIANGLVEKFGTPTYVSPYNVGEDKIVEDWFEELQNNNSANYNVFYIYDEYVVILELKDYGGIKSDQELKVARMRYMTLEYWQDLQQEYNHLWEIMK